MNRQHSDYNQLTQSSRNLMDFSSHEWTFLQMTFIGIILTVILITVLIQQTENLDARLIGILSNDLTNQGIKIKETYFKDFPLSAGITSESCGFSQPGS